MSNSKPVLRAVILPSDVMVSCDGCYFKTPTGFTCNGDTAGAAAPAQCCNFDGHWECVIFKEVAREPVR